MEHLGLPGALQQPVGEAGGHHHHDGVRLESVCPDDLPVTVPHQQRSRPGGGDQEEQAPVLVVRYSELFPLRPAGGGGRTVDMEVLLTIYSCQYNILSTHTPTLYTSEVRL